MTDLSAYVTAKDAASALANYLRDTLDNMIMFSPDEVIQREIDGHHEVIWESGPYNWSLCLLGGDSMYAAELCDYSGPAQVTGIEGENWCAEAKNTFTIAFYTN